MTLKLVAYLKTIVIPVEMHVYDIGKLPSSLCLDRPIRDVYRNYSIGGSNISAI